MMPASIRGETRYCTGLIAITVSASICSVACIEPSSAAIAEPARAAIINAASTGPSSRTSTSATTVPSAPSEPNRRSVL